MKQIIFIVLAVFIVPRSIAQTVTINVDASVGKTSISPSIFGMNNSDAENLSAAKWKCYRDAGLKMFRENGGNNATKYNWRLKLSSHPDWYNNVYGGGGGWDSRAKIIQDSLPDASTMWAFQLIG